MSFFEVSQLIRKLITKFAYRWSGESSDSCRQSLVVIIPRKRYYEKLEKFPVSDKKNLTGLLQNRYLGKYAVHLLVQSTQRSTTVRSFLLDAEVKTLFPRALFFIPSSLLAFDDGEDKTIKLQSEFGSEVYYGRAGRDIFSALKGGNIVTPEAFLIANNYLGDSEEFKFRADAEILSHFSLATLYRILATTFIKPENISSYLGLKSKLIILASAFLSYQLLAAAYLFTPYQDSFNESDRAKITELVDKERQTREYDETILARSRILEQKSNSAVLWVVLGEFKQSGAELLSFESDGESMIIRGSADNATELVRKIAENKDFVSEVGFDAPIRSDAEKQSFVIRVVLK